LFIINFPVHNLLILFIINSSVHNLLLLFIINSPVHNLLLLFFINSPVHNLLLLFFILSPVHNLLLLFFILSPVHNLLLMFIINSPVHNLLCLYFLYFTFYLWSSKDETSQTTVRNLFSPFLPSRVPCKLKLQNWSDNFRIKSLFNREQGAIQCVIYFLFLHFFI